MQELEFCHLAAISIHAPAKGATAISCISGTFSFISIHAPAKGATINHRIFRWVFSRFQSTLPRRERRLKALVIAVWMPISIHAPAKGATYFRSIFRGIFRFQSTLPRRERPLAVTVSAIFQHFNPRSREGSDKSRQLFLIWCGDFNPRSREGSDNSRFFIFSPPFYISIHAPAKGATMKVHTDDDGEVFQSTLPRRERLTIQKTASQ